MLYVSFAEIFCIKSVEAFEEHGYSGNEAIRYATFCFFSGICLTGLLDKLVHLLAYMQGSSHGHSHALDVVESHRNAHQNSTCAHNQAETGGLGLEGQEGDLKSKSEKELQKMGLLTAVAICFHNFPEGLATFVATLADSSVGGAIAIAIALHNIPEGVCIAMPIYYATGSRWKGIFWSFISGLSEPIGGLLGYLFLYGDNMSAFAFAILFGVVAGMMVFISVAELIPTALKYDPEDMFVSNSVFAGMALMAASLLMFVA